MSCELKPYPLKPYPGPAPIMNLSVCVNICIETAAFAHVCLYY